VTARLALVVDDDDDIRMITSLTLRRVAGWEVLTASGGQEGIDLARERRPDVVLMDLMMPGMDGVTAAKLLLDDPATADIPIVLLTAKASISGTQPPWDGLPIAGVVSKPFNPRSLADEVGALVGWE